ncbi:hypothetical protein EJB05_50381, partial [Eragrostis curvula]
LGATTGAPPAFGSEAFGFVNVALVPFTSWFLTYEKEKLAGLVVAEHCPKIVAWAGRCRDRGSVAKALSDPDQVFQVAQFLRSKFGYK